ncbi:MAG: helix-turn-helix domain-containing protein [Patescibacteria group bacterium]
MYEKTLYNLGLSKVQAEILDSLLNSGPDKASNIAKKIKRPRGVAYKGLDELIRLNLVSKTEEVKGITIFAAEHPYNLETIAEQKEKEAIKHKQEFINALPDLISAYSLISNKPGVRFYEGEEGLRKILEDTLSSKTEIYLLLNKQALNEEGEFQEANLEYKQKREKLGIKKKIIRVGERPDQGSEQNSEYEKITAIRYLENLSATFKTSIQIYDGKISFQVINKGKIISILIENKDIYEMNRLMFETLWSISKE